MACTTYARMARAVAQWLQARPDYQQRVRRMHDLALLEVPEILSQLLGKASTPPIRTPSSPPYPGRPGAQALRTVQ